jgi:hypothetical protein
MNNTLEDIQLTSEQQYPLTTFSPMTVGRTMPMQNAAIALALTFAMFNLGLITPQFVPTAVMRPSLTRSDAAAYSIIGGDVIVDLLVRQNTFYVHEATKVVRHSAKISSFFEEATDLPEIDRPITKVRGKSRVVYHRSPLSTIGEEV